MTSDVAKKEAEMTANHPAVPRLKHLPVKAAELRNGDLMRVGSSTNYVLVHTAQADVYGQINVTIYSGTVPNPNGPTLRFSPDAEVSLSMRDAKP